MTQTIAIIDYGSGNLRSVEKALARAAREAGMAAVVSVTSNPDLIRNADRLVLPGVGAFGACMSGLAAAQGVLEAMEHAALVEQRPFLGICVGMQLLADRGLEFGEHQGLGWIGGDVTALDQRREPGRTPHMGWNTIRVRAPHPLFDDLDEAAFYFAHSFCFAPGNDAHKAAVCEYGGAFAAAVIRDNIAGVQFHPEKSQDAGLRLLRNFLHWTPA